MKDKLLLKLQESGLTKREAHIYLALLQKKEFSASEIASIIPVGRTKIYEIIPNLITKGLCIELQKDGKKIYSAVEPKIALESLLSFFKQKVQEDISEKEEEIVKKQNMFKALENDLDKIYTNNSQKSDNMDYIEVLKDKNQIKRRWIELQKNTKHEMLGFNKPPYSMAYGENLKHQKILMKGKKILNKGIYEFSQLYSGEKGTEFLKIFESYQKLGEECRVVDKLPMKLMIMDEKVAMLALNDPISMAPTITTVIIDHPSFALAQKEVFESYWKKALPLDVFRKKIKQNKK